LLIEKSHKGKKLRPAFQLIKGKYKEKNPSALKIGKTMTGYQSVIIYIDNLYIIKSHIGK
jgi:hypothetical protein